MKYLPLALMLAIGLSAAAREVININRDWEFRHVDSAEFRHVNLPHDFQIHQPWVEPGPDERPDLNNQVANIKSRLSARGFKEMGAGIYRKQLVADTAWRGKRVLLDFKGIMLTGSVSIDGRKIAEIPYGYLGREVDITPYLKYDGPVTIEVVASTGKPDNSRWYTGGGLYRDVNVVVTPADYYFERHPLHVTTSGIDSASTVKITAEIACTRKGKKTLLAETVIYGPDGVPVARSTSPVKLSSARPVNEFALDSILIANPRLWDCEQPDLYRAEVTLKDGDSIIDKASTRFGIREIAYTPEQGFLLNGKKVLFKGIANHHTLGALGAAAFPDAIAKRIRLLKEFGFNHIRTSHNPYSEEFLDLCDENGILVVDELYDKWLTQYAGGSRDWMEQWPEAVPEWIKRDRNHPSVVMWSLGNELQTLWALPYHDYGVTPYRLQKALLKRYDTERPVTVAMHPRGRDPQTDSLPCALARETDIAAYNYRYMYFPGDRRRFPHMIFYQSEANASGLGTNWFGMELDKVIGLAYWGAIDYLGESQGWPAKGWDKGVFDISLNPKPQAWLVRSYFKPDEPLVHIGVVSRGESSMWNGIETATDDIVDHWNHQPGDTLNIVTYTNCDEVELSLNGTSLGRIANDTVRADKRNRIQWPPVPYRKGTLRAVGYKDGQVVTEHVLRTSGHAVRLSAMSDVREPEFTPDGMTLRHITISAVDSRGDVVPDENRQLTVTVDGPAEIAGFINGDIRTPETFDSPVHSLWNGKAQLILRSTQEPGAVKVTVSAEGLKKSTLKVR